MYGRQRELGKDQLFGLDIPWKVSVWETEGVGDRPVLWVGHSMGGECMGNRELGTDQFCGLDIPWELNIWKT